MALEFSRAALSNRAESAEYTALKNVASNEDGRRPVGAAGAASAQSRLLDGWHAACAFLVQFIIISGILCACSRQSSQDQMLSSRNTGKVNAMLSQAEAIEIARKAILGKVKVQRGAPITTTPNQKEIVVTFGYVNSKGPPGLGPGFAAKVTIDRTTGRVKNILRGPD